MLSSHPMVSVLINCKNGARTIRRPLEALLVQTYPRLEIVFLDGGSTDGTPEIVHEYMGLHPGCIRLISEPDSCGEEGFFRALQACEGEIIGSSMSDEELLPEAVATAVDHFRLNPEAGALYGDAHLTDIEGTITGTWVAQPFSLKGYLCREVDPPFVSSFFRRAALIEAGLFTRTWTWGVGEYELWVRLGMKYPVVYVPGVLAKYAVHPQSSSSRVFSDSEAFIQERTRFFDLFFAEPDLPESIRTLRPQAQAGLHLFIAEVLVGLGEYDKARAQLLEAMNHKPNGPRLLELAQRLSGANLEWNLRMLQAHITHHLASRPACRIVCYGAGNDFLALLAADVFQRHTLVAVVDNRHPRGSFVGDVAVISEADLRPTEHDLLVITSSRWANECRNAAIRRVIRDKSTVPII